MFLFNQLKLLKLNMTTVRYFTKNRLSVDSATTGDNKIKKAEVCLRSDNLRN